MHLLYSVAFIVNPSIIGLPPQVAHQELAAAGFRFQVVLLFSAELAFGWGHVLNQGIISEKGLEQILGKNAKVDIEKGTPLDWDLVEK